MPETLDHARRISLDPKNRPGSRPLEPTDEGKFIICLTPDKYYGVYHPALAIHKGYTKTGKVRVNLYGHSDKDIAVDPLRCFADSGLEEYDQHGNPA